jgi:hypothetical protein
MKVVLNYDPSTGQVTDTGGMMIVTWVGLNYEELPSESAQSNYVDGEQLIRIMKIAAHVKDANKVKDL